MPRFIKTQIHSILLYIISMSCTTVYLCGPRVPTRRIDFDEGNDWRDLAVPLIIASHRPRNRGNRRNSGAAL